MLILLIVAMMIVPLAPWMMDVLISFNLGVSMLIFSLALFQKNPLQFTAFPSVLLMATLYRLALNISSTRLILTRADAGEIIGGFGGFIVGGDIIVGAVIFGVILMVLFLVITKGAERVAEVAARFTLDALPGMQLAIETDLRSKTISPREVTLRRETLEKRSMYYGSLDGAMKFVRGDAIAALVITATNVLGGTLIGVLRKDMSIADALDVYGRLTVGDGLVTMIPALLISTAAGLLVTRVAQGYGNGTADDSHGIALFSVPQALYAAAAMLLVLAAAPGLPAWPFVVAAVCLLGIALVRSRTRIKAAGESDGKRHLSTESSVSLDEMQTLLDNVARYHPVLVREAVWGRISLSQLADLLADLKADGVSQQHLPEILEALAREKVVDDIDDMLIRIRRRLAPLITRTISGNDVNSSAPAPLRVVTIDLETEQMLQTSMVATSSGKRLVLPPDLLDDLKSALQGIPDSDPPALLLVAPVLRRPLQRLLQTFCSVRVVGHEEMTASSVEVCAELSL